MEHTALILITFLAATVNGALGYGFSSITVPVALLFYTNRVLNPALVLVEMVINAYVLVINRHSVPRIWKRALPLLLGVFPGVALGSYILFVVTPGWIKFITYCALLPLILLQAAGIRRPLRSERAIGLPFGMGIGVLYSVTTISGPPLALLFNNQGYAKQDFRAALGLIRVAESTVTAVAYYYLGLYNADSTEILTAIVPSVLIGIPLGTFLIRRIDPETFRRICMSFDAWVVGFGLSKVLIELRLAPSPDAYAVLAAVIMVDGYLLVRFFRGARPEQVVPREQNRVPP
jgi:uncharacterized membrane protein YfcA